MSRAPTPPTIEDAPAASQPLPEAVRRQMGVVPNMFRLIGNSPATLKGYLGMAGALGDAALPAATRERLALAVGDLNGCDYCRSAHTNLGRNLARLDDAEITAGRLAGYSDAQVLEIILHVALNTFTNYVNEAPETDIDVPVVRARQAA